MKNPFNDEIEVKASSREPILRTILIPVSEPPEFIPVRSGRVSEQRPLVARYIFDRTEHKHVYKFDGFEGR